jgi:undecaprenyl-diphosphatase
MLNYFQSMIMGLVQGIAEPFPISSLGHSVIIPSLLGWNINQNDPFFLTFLVATHLATALVFLGLFWREWANILKGLGRSLKGRNIAPGDTYAKLGWLLVVGTIPAGVLGVLLQEKLALLFASAQFAAFFLMLNGVLLYVAERLRRRSEIVDPSSANLDELESNPAADQSITKRVGWWGSAAVGAAQALALLPGFSRSGSTMGGSLLVGLNNEEAARFSFLMATPLIFAAALLKLPMLFSAGNLNLLGIVLVGGIFAAIAAYLSVKFLLRFFRSNRLTPFAIYCFLAGLATSIYFWVK